MIQIGVINKNYLQIAKQQLPESIFSDDMISIVDEDDTVFTRESRPTQFFFAAEKSMYQTISEEMINMFASVVDFNNLIGEPVNRYRSEYKDLTKLRQLFFESIDNTADLDKYVDFYKWIDTSIFEILKQLTPASANISETLHNMVESHVLERNLPFIPRFDLHFDPRRTYRRLTLPARPPPPPHPRPPRGPRFPCRAPRPASSAP